MRREMKEMKATVSLFRTNAKKMRFFLTIIRANKLKTTQKKRYPVKLILAEVERLLFYHNHTRREQCKRIDM